MINLLWIGGLSPLVKPAGYNCVMRTQTHSTIKICKSCFEKLPIQCFGINRASKDGSNYQCYNCRNAIRRFKYNPNHEGHDLPGSISNRLLIQKILKKGGGVKGLSDVGDLYVVQLLKDEYWIKVSIFKNEDLEISYMCLESSVGDICDVVCDYLNLKSIKLKDL